MRVSIRPVLDCGLCEDLWRRFSRTASRPSVWHPYFSLSDYEHWKHYLERGVGTFWASQGERLCLLAAYREEEARGLVRVLLVPIFAWDEGDWGPGSSRGEIQDLLYEHDDEDAATELVKGAIEVLKAKGVEKIGGSAWRSSQCETFRHAGFRPFRRSILLGWRTDHDIQVRKDTGIALRYIQPGGEALVQEVLSSTWGIPVTALPHMDVQQPIVAMARERPVGVVLPNNHTGSLDLGVHVIAEYRRRYIGSALAKESASYCRRKHLRHMYVVRNLPLNGLTEEDEIALRFYAATGARPLREYTGFQLL